MEARLRPVLLKTINLFHVFTFINPLIESPQPLAMAQWWLL
jgi:hypothetical protein